MTATAIITGGSGSIGFACAQILAARGYEVVLTARRPGALSEAAAKIGARWVTADCSDEQEFAAVIDTVDRVDFVVHAAGMLAGTFFRKDSIATFDRVIAANLRSAFVVAFGVLPKMEAGGRMIFVSSTAGIKGMKGISAYSASKAGLNVFARTLGAELERDGINVHILTPGPTDTPMLDTVTFPMYSIDSADVARAVGYLDSLPPGVIVREIKIRAAEEGPFAPKPLPPRGSQMRTPVSPTVADAGHPPASGD